MSDKSEAILSKLNKHIPTEVVEKNKQLSVQSKSELTDVNDDYDYSRETYKRLVDKGQEAIDHMMELALQSDHPRAYEVLGGMLKNVSDMTDKLMTLHKNVDAVKSKKEESTPKSSGGTVTNNNVFVGSTTDLQRYIIAQQKQPRIINDDED